MPRKMRQLRRELAHEGFRELPGRGKGSHTWWEHPTGVTINLPGHDGDDAKPYLEKLTRDAIERAQARSSRQSEKGPQL